MKISKVPIEESTYIRDTESKAILASNLEEKQRFIMAQQDINNIKSDLTDIKSLLTKLIEK